MNLNGVIPIILGLLILLSTLNLLEINGDLILILLSIYLIIYGVTTFLKSNQFKN